MLLTYVFKKIYKFTITFQTICYFLYMAKKLLATAFMQTYSKVINPNSQIRLDENLKLSQQLAQKLHPRSSHPFLIWKLICGTSFHTSKLANCKRENIARDFINRFLLTAVSLKQVDIVKALGRDEIYEKRGLKLISTQGLWPQNGGCVESFQLILVLVFLFVWENGVGD